MTSKLIKKSGGFTLLEVVVVIVVAGVLAAMLTAFIGPGIARSVNPIIMVQEQGDLNQVMEKIIEEYKDRIASSTLHLDTLYTWITANYGSYVVDNGTPHYILFNASNQEVSCTYGSAGCLGLKLSLREGNQTITGILTE
jgi:prepilin-type N-terminal cleavage/methylation domain-containing protein